MKNFIIAAAIATSSFGANPASAQANVAGSPEMVAAIAADRAARALDGAAKAATFDVAEAVEWCRKQNACIDTLQFNYDYSKRVWAP